MNSDDPTPMEHGNGTADTGAIDAASAVRERVRNRASWCEQRGGRVGELTRDVSAAVCAVEDVRLRWVGHRVRAEIGVVVESTLGVVEAQAISIDGRHRLRHEVPQAGGGGRAQESRNHERHPPRDQVGDGSALEGVESRQNG